MRRGFTGFIQGPNVSAVSAKQERVVYQPFSSGVSTFRVDCSYGFTLVFSNA